MNIIKVKNKDLKFIDECALNEWYAEYNKLYFNNLLFNNPDIQIVNKNNSYFGYCTYAKKQILMNAYNLDGKYIISIKNTLLHEMIHMMQGNLGYVKGHGKSFLNKAKEINKDGWNIKVHVDEDIERFIEKIENDVDIDICLPLVNKVNSKFIINLLKEIYDVKGIELNMQDLEVKLANTRNELEVIFDTIDEDDSINESDWKIFLAWKNDKAIWKLDKEGDKSYLVDCFENIVGFIENFPKLKGTIKFNNVRNIVEYNGRQITDNDYHTIINYINKYFIPTFSRIKMIKEACDNVANKNKYNPWINYFNSLKYKDDGIDWIEYTIKNVLCCEEQEKYYDLYYETLKIMLVGVMARIYNKEVGKAVKIDMVPTFCGENGGSGKTTFFERLFDLDDHGNSYCYVVAGDSFQPKEKDFLERTHQAVCVLIDELTMKRSVVTSIKGYITQRDDRFRKSYGYNSEAHLRGFIITATSNNNDILKDYTTDNERRWGIIKISEDTDNYIKVNKAFDEGLRDKLFTQVKEIYNKGDYKLWICDKKLESLEKEIQRDYKASNNADYNTIIDDLLEREYGFVDNRELINVDYIVQQYLYGDSDEWCHRHNEEMTEKLKRAEKEQYILKPDEQLIKSFGKINKIKKNDLYLILNKLGFEYTKVSLNAEIRYCDRWNGWERGKNACRINGSLVNAYWRKENYKSKAYEYKIVSREQEIPF